MKKIGIFVLVLVMVFAFTIPAAAGGYGGGGGNVSSSTGTGQGQPDGRGTFVMVGTITSLGTNTITINVVRGNKLVQPNLGTQITVSVTHQTLILYRDATTITMISFADLHVGQRVSIFGIYVNNVWTVYRITVGALLSCIQ